MENLFKTINENIKKGTNLLIITSRFSLKAFYKLLPILEQCSSIKIILNDPKILEKNKHDDIPSYEINLIETNFLTSEFELNLKEDLLDPYKAQVVKNFIQEHVEIKIVREEWRMSGILFLNQENQKHIAYLDQINLNTLGLTNKTPSQKPYVGSDKGFINYVKGEFERYWLSQELSIDYKKQFIKKLAEIFESKTPKFLYLFSLMHIFSRNLKEYQNGSIQKITDYKQTQIYQSLYDFQRVAVEAVIEKINLYNGCILADAVGLGKTYEALAVIKYFELQGKNTLVLTPKKLGVNWDRFNKNYANNIFQGKERFHYQILNHTDLTRTKGESYGIDLAKHAWGNYDLVVIDESHNFRNRSWTNEMEGEVKNKGQRYDFLMEKIIKEGRKTSVLLLSATPVNNRMQDISNQISLITSDQDNYFHSSHQIKSTKQVCNYAEKQARKWADMDEKNRTSEEFQKMIGLQFRKLVDLVSIARSRKQVQQNYQADHLSFAERLQPISLKPNIDTESNQNNISDLNDDLKKLYFAAYKIWNYILDEHLEFYEKEYRQKNNLSGQIKNFRSIEEVGPLMRTNILKRFESSVYAFQITINKIKDFTINYYNTILQTKEILKPEFNNLASYEEQEEDNLDEIKNNWINVKKEHVDLVKLKYELEHDIKLLEKITSYFSQIDNKRDNKLKEVIDVINKKINNPFNGNNQKLIVFTSFVDTAQYLYQNLKNVFAKQGIYCGIVTGEAAYSNHPELSEERKVNIDDLLTYFSPKSKNLKQKTYLKQNVKFDILIATDCISEGQDLQDCDFLINYDIHWNPVRIIQRFGRIDRLESSNKKIQMVNVWPNVELDAYIKLEPKIESKMKKVGAGGTNDFEEESLKKQLSKLDEKDVDLDEIQGQNSFSHLTLSEFTSDLKMNLVRNSKSLTNQPSGIYAIAKADQYFEPGIIFLFKLNPKIQVDNNNQINPYYLIYVNENNEIKFNYNQAFEILNVYKAIANNQDKTQASLIDQFNQETNFGQNMDKYQKALSKALEETISTNNKEDVENFLMGAVSQNDHSINENDYELISFLIIKE